MNYPGLIPSQSEPLWCKPWVCSDWSEPCSWLFPHMDSAWTLHWHYTVYSVFPPSSRSIFTLHSPAEESPQCGIPLACPHSTVNAPWSTIHPHSASTLILALTPLKLLFISNLAYPAKHIACREAEAQQMFLEGMTGFSLANTSQERKHRDPLRCSKLKFLLICYLQVHFLLFKLKK